MNKFPFFFRSIALLCIIFISTRIPAQRPVSNAVLDSLKIQPAITDNICNNDNLLNQLRKDPNFRLLEEKMNLEILHASRTTANDTIILPVVVHIINPNPSSISDASVINGINDLNDAFSKSGAYAASLGADTKIRFCLSKNAPDSGITTGITRTTSFFSTHMNMDIEDRKLKNLIQWDPRRYINIWLITSIDAEAFALFSCGTWTRLGVGGYATFPPGGGPTDGIVITGFGTLLVHEMGHYLGLYHTFEGLNCANFDCTINGDRVCDTPPDRNMFSAASCTLPGNSCTTDTLSSYSNGHFPVDVPDQIRNFMDYGNNGCHNLFTQGQADRMRATILTQRSGLLQDECTPPCVENIIAGFTRTNVYPLPGDAITFTNISTGASNYQWLVDDVVVSSTANLTHVFSALGKYKVTLKAYNTPACFASYTDYIIVTCGVTARFYTNKKTIASNAIHPDSIIFTNNSYNGISYQWLIGNDRGMAEQVVSASTNLTYVFTDYGNFRVRLVATNGSCSDTTYTYIVPVANPTPDLYPYTITLTCFNQNKVRVFFCIANNGYASVPTGTPINFYDANPALSTANRISPTFFIPNPIVGGNCGYCFSHVIDVPYRGLDRVWMVVNDAGISIPVVLPNASLLERSYTNNTIGSTPIKTIVNISLCAGQAYAGYNTSGTYIDTLISFRTGCDSIRTLNLTVKPTFTTSVTTSICQGQNYAGHTTTGTFVDVYTARNGCDSTRTLFLTVKPIFATSVTATICQGQNYAGHITTGTYTDVYTAANGCDSTRTLQLTVNPKKFTTLNPEICFGETYLAGGRLQTATGIYFDTLRTYLNCDSVITTNLIVHPLPAPDLGIDRGVCIGDMLTLNPGNFTSYVWQDGSSSSTFTTNTVGNYSVSVTDIFGCKNTDAMRLTEIYQLPADFMPPDSSLCRGNIVRVNIKGYKNYSWSTGSTNKFIDITKTGTYHLQVTDIYGCIGSDSMYISFYDCVTIQVPNAFTPNNDGLNDIYKPLIPAPLNNYYFEIRNRWGQLVFETRNYLAGWDGKINSRLQSTNTFVYLITFTDADGVNVKKYGTMTLIR